MATSKSTVLGDKKASHISIWKRIDKIFARGSRAVELILSVAFVFAVLLNFVTAIDRYLFGYSIIGSDEVQTYIMVWMTFVGAAAVSWRHQHLRMDVLVSRFPHRARVALFGVELILILGLMIMLAEQSFHYAEQMKLIDRRSDLAGLPMWIPHGGLFIGFGLIALVTLWRIIGLFAARTEPEDHPSDVRI
jgi:TRAP-type C4-dicarboxylate transport system permease small subunit